MFERPVICEKNDFEIIKPVVQIVFVSLSDSAICSCKTFVYFSMISPVTTQILFKTEWTKWHSPHRLGHYDEKTFDLIYGL